MQSHKNDTTYKMGIDIGSTTVKVVLADEENKIAFSRYRRHFSEIKKTVKDILGYRVKITAVWDWIPANFVTDLLDLFKTGAFLWVEYPSPNKSGAGFFSIEYPTLSVFCYKNGIPVWHDMTLSMTAQEVITA